MRTANEHVLAPPLDDGLLSYLSAFRGPRTGYSVINDAGSMRRKLGQRRHPDLERGGYPEL